MTAKNVQNPIKSIAIISHSLIFFTDKIKET